MRKKEYNVYKIVNNINLKVYIGRTVGTLANRWKGHMKCLNDGDTRQLYNAMRKHGVENFNIELIESCSSFQEMVEKEKYYCAEYDAYYNGYNMTEAGEINPMECEQAKRSHDEKMRSEDVRRRISESMKNVRKNSTKTVLIHKDRKGKRVSPDELQSYLDQGYLLGSNSVGKTRIYNPELDKESTIWLDNFPEYEKQGWVIGGKPGKIKEEQRLILDASHFKKVYCILKNGEKSEIFESVRQAAKWWYGYLVAHNYKIINRAHKDYYALADIIKKSNRENLYIYDALWIYR